MAKEKSEKKEKKEKREKRSDTEGVTKKSKKDKKEKKEKSQEQIDALLKESKPAESEAKTNGVKEDEDVEMDDKARVPIPKEALVPFANPLADDKQTKKLLKSVRKAAKHKTLKRGVKEVVKAIRKGETAKSTSSSPGVVVLAADISPMDVISHIPVLCEDHNIPYIYVTSRAELGAAGNTKRPTSVVMISKDKLKKKGAEVDAEAQNEYTEVYSDLVKLVLKAGATVKV